MSTNTSSRPPLKPARGGKKDISKTVTATKNLRAISLSLVQKLRSAPQGLPSTDIANQLAKEAVKQVVGINAQISQSDLVAIEKNIRRRLYDSLKVLVSIGAIRRSFSDKMLHWQGVAHLFPSPATSSSSNSNQTSHSHSPSPPPSPQLRQLSASLCAIRQRLDEKAATLQQLLHHKLALERLCRRNGRNFHSVHPSLKIYMPFVLIRTPRHTDITLESTPDTQNMAFHFSGQFEIVNDAGVLDRLFCVEHPEQPQTPQQKPPIHAAQPTRTSRPLPPPTPPPPFPPPVSFPTGSASQWAPPPSEGATIRSPELSSPKRVRVLSSSPFPKFAQDEKTPLEFTPHSAPKRHRYRPRSALLDSNITTSPATLPADVRHATGPSPSHALGCKQEMRPSSSDVVHDALFAPFSACRSSIDEGVDVGSSALSPSASPVVPANAAPGSCGSPGVSERVLTLGTSPGWASLSTPEGRMSCRHRLHALEDHIDDEVDITPPRKQATSRLAPYYSALDDLGAKCFDSVGTGILSSPRSSPLVTPANWNFSSRMGMAVEGDSDPAARRLFT